MGKQKMSKYKRESSDSTGDRIILVCIVYQNYNSHGILWWHSKLRLWHRFYPWPGNFCEPQVWQKNPKNKQTKKLPTKSNEQGVLENIKRCLVMSKKPRRRFPKEDFKVRFER